MKKGLIVVLAVLFLGLVSCTKEETPVPAEPAKTEVSATVENDSTVTDTTKVEVMATETKETDDAKKE